MYFSTSKIFLFVKMIFRKSVRGDTELNWQSAQNPKCSFARNYKIVRIDLGKKLKILGVENIMKRVLYAGIYTRIIQFLNLAVTKLLAESLGRRFSA